MIGVILNPRSGYASSRGVTETVALIQLALPNARIHVLDPCDELSVCCRELVTSGATTIAVAGGDGTVNGVAAALVATETVLGVLPAGTFNHFARDIGLRDMRHALDVLKTGYVASIDMGEVNGRLFLNSSSIGIYPHLVQARDSAGLQHGRGPVTLEAALLMAQQLNRGRVTFTAITESAEFHGCSFLFVGNNRYMPNPLHRRIRPRLDEGVLSSVIVAAPSPGAAADGVPLAHEGHLERYGPHLLTTRELIIELVGADATPVSADGEVRVLQGPLEYRVRPRALRIAVPATFPRERTAPLGSSTWPER